MNYSKERGLTLVEVLIVVAIIALFAVVIAIPNNPAKKIVGHQSSQKEEVLEPGEIVIDKIPEPAYNNWYLIVHNYEKDYVKAKRVDIKTYYKTEVEK